jgi:hypothetical protein
MQRIGEPSFYVISAGNYVAVMPQCLLVDVTGVGSQASFSP